MFGVFVALGASGCGSSGEPTGDSQASLASCNAYCDAYVAKTCTPTNYTTADACKLAECKHLPEDPAICQTKIKIYYDCQNAQLDICTGDMGCASQFHDVEHCQ